MTDIPRRQRALLNIVHSNSDLLEIPQSSFEQQLAIGLLLEPDGVCIFDNCFWSPHLATYLGRFVNEPDGSWISAALEFPGDTAGGSPVKILRKDASARTLAEILSFYQQSAIGHYQDYPVDHARLSKIDITTQLVDPQNTSSKIVDTLTDIFATPPKDYLLFLQENRDRFPDCSGIGLWLSSGFENARHAFEECMEAYVKTHDGRPGTDIRVSDVLKTFYRLRFGEILKPKADVGMRRIITGAWPSGPEREHALTFFRLLSKLYGRRDAAQNNIAINDQSKGDLYEFFLAAHKRGASPLVAPTEDFEFQMPSPSILVNTKGSYLKAVRGSAEFTEYQQAWRDWRDRQFGSPDAGKEKLKEKLRAYAKKWSRKSSRNICGMPMRWIPPR